MNNWIIGIEMMEESMIISISCQQEVEKSKACRASAILKSRLWISLVASSKALTLLRILDSAGTDPPPRIMFLSESVIANSFRTSSSEHSAVITGCTSEYLLSI